MFNSLLWLEGSKVCEIDAKVIRDLRLDVFYRALEGEDQRFGDILNRLCIDEKTLQYRQAIIADLIDMPELGNELEASFQAFSELSYRFMKEPAPEGQLYYLIDLVAIIETSIQCLNRLNEILTYYPCRSEGLLTLKDVVGQAIASKDYKTMQSDLKDIRYAFSRIKSAEIAINLNPGMRPFEARVTHLLDHPCKYPEAFRQVSMVLKEDGIFLGRPINTYAPVFKIGRIHFNLQEELEYGLRSYNKQLKAFLEKYKKIDPTPYVQLHSEFVFYKESVTLLQKLSHAKLPLCIPDLTAMASRSLHVEGAYNLHLANSMDPDHLVMNTFTMDDQGRLFILTGANSGGKTTFTRTIGQIQVLAQLGLMVPAKAAVLSIVDGVFTHFPVTESETMDLGRLGKECVDFEALYQKSSSYSLLLLNESFSSTSHLESLQIAMGVVKAVKHKRTRMIFNTHLHELVEEVLDLNDQMQNDTVIVSILSGSGDDITSYHIQKGLPLGKSHAYEIAKRHGVTFPQLMEQIGKEGNHHV